MFLSSFRIHLWFSLCNIFYLATDPSSWIFSLAWFWCRCSRCPSAYNYPDCHFNDPNVSSFSIYLSVFVLFIWHLKVYNFLFFFKFIGWILTWKHTVEHYQCLVREFLLKLCLMKWSFFQSFAISATTTLGFRGLLRIHGDNFNLTNSPSWICPLLSSIKV